MRSGYMGVRGGNNLMTSISCEINRSTLCLRALNTSVQGKVEAAIFDSQSKNDLETLALSHHCTETVSESASFKARLAPSVENFPAPTFCLSSVAILCFMVAIKFPMLLTMEFMLSIIFS